MMLELSTLYRLQYVHSRADRLVIGSTTCSEDIHCTLDTCVQSPLSSLDLQKPSTNTNLKKDISNPMAEIKSDPSTTPSPSPSKAEQGPYPWLPAEYSNGAMTFETHFQDWEIEMPSLAVLMEALSADLDCEWWRRIRDGVWAEVGAAGHSVGWSGSGSAAANRGDSQCPV